MDLREEFLVAQLPHWVLDPDAAWTPFAAQGHTKDDVANAYSTLADRCSEDDPALSLTCRLAAAHLHVGALVRLYLTTRAVTHRLADGDAIPLSYASHELVASVLRIDTLAARACALGMVARVAWLASPADDFFDRVDHACTQLIAEALSPPAGDEPDPEALSILGDVIYAADDDISLALHAVAFTVGGRHESPVPAWVNSLGSLDAFLPADSPHRTLIPVLESCLDRGQLPMDPHALGSLYPDDAFVAELKRTQARTSAADVIRLLDETCGSGPDPLSGTAASPRTDNDRGSAPTVSAMRPDLSAVLASLDQLVGLDGVKHRIRDLIAIHQVNQERLEHGMPPIEHALHLVFTGPPGTGKTTVARLVAQAYAAIGVLESGVFKEAGRVDLVSGYVGQTAIKTQAVIDAATGGILFIDEAYSLTDDDQDPFGAEAIATLLKAMEDRRDDFAVIAAGYTDEMQRFIDSNPGLRSRFPTTIEFPPYSDAELLEILRRIAIEHQITVPQTVEAKVLDVLAHDRELVAAGNGRYARNLFEAMTTNMAVRAMADGGAEPNEYTTFTTNDVPASLGG